MISLAIHTINTGSTEIYLIGTTKTALFWKEVSLLKIKETKLF
jgi:hypothetical protein